MADSGFLRSCATFAPTASASRARELASASAPRRKSSSMAAVRACASVNPATPMRKSTTAITALTIAMAPAYGVVMGGKSVGAGKSKPADPVPARTTIAKPSQLVAARPRPNAAKPTPSGANSSG